MEQDNLYLQKISILNWNANGLKRQRSLIIDFLYRYQITIACITETHLIKNEKLKIPGYSILRADRETEHASGGVAILIKHKINQQEIPLPKCQNLEITGKQIKLNDSTAIKIISVYRQPNKKLLSEDLTKIFSTSEPTLLIGDLNSKNTFWGCRVSNPSGNLLDKIATDNTLHIEAPAEYTYYPTRRNHKPDILDILVSKNFTKTISQTVIPELNSDHLPVIISWDSAPTPIQTKQKLINGKIDWHIFKNTLDNKILPPKVNTREEIDTQVNTYTKDITGSIKMATLHNNRQSNITPKHHKTPNYILSLIDARCRLRREFQRTRNSRLKNQINNLGHKIHRELDTLRIEAYNKHIEQLEPNDPGMWKTTKRILSQPHTIAPIIVDDQTYYTDSEKCEHFSNHLEKVFRSSNSTKPRHQSMVINHIETHVPLINDIEPTSPKELKQIIQILPTKKSPGPDLIPNLVLKQFTTNFLAFLASLLNACMSMGYFPNEWKKAHVLLFHKTGKNKNQLASYRPISLLNTMAKLLEKIIHKRLETQIEIKEAIPALQFGFRKRHSTSQQLLRLSEIIETGFENKEYTTILFLDIAQAFDRVWLEGLKFKLLQLELPPYLTAILFSFLEERNFAVKINNELSSLKQIKAGVPQGSILGPMLFNIYVRDIPTATAALAMFADDTAIITQSVDLHHAIEELQAATNIISKWFDTWNITLNVGKCESKIFTLRQIRNPPKLVLNNQTIEWNPKDKTVKYLGIQFDTRLTWSSHINHKLQLARVRLQQLYPLLNRKSKLQIKCAILLYKALLRPLLLYGCEVWGNTSITNLNKIQSFQNKVLRIAVNAPWFLRNEQLHKELPVPHVSDFIKKCTKRFNLNIKNCDSALTLNIGRKNIHHRLKRQLPQDIYLSDEDTNEEINN